MSVDQFGVYHAVTLWTTVNGIEQEPLGLTTITDRADAEHFVREMARRLGAVTFLWTNGGTTPWGQRIRPKEKDA